MPPGGDKFVRFADWRSENSYNSENWYSSDEGFYGRRVRPFVSGAWGSVRRGWESGSERLRSMRKPLNLSSASQVKQPCSYTKVFDPQSQFLQGWNKVFVLVCVFALAVDPLFFYIPVIDKNWNCLNLDKNLEIVACLLRSFIDVVYLLRIVFQFRTGYIAPSSRVFGRGELVNDSVGIAKRYLTSYFFVDVLAILPLPQIVVLSIIPSLTGPIPLVAKNLLKFIVLVQYVPRFIRIYPLYKEVTTTSGMLTEMAWMGAAYNLLLYLLASHIIGSVWYLLSIEREDSCWRIACHNRRECNHLFLYCGSKQKQDNSFLRVSCPFIQPDGIKDLETFNFGIFIDALDSRVVESTDSLNKMLYCFWWGLRNLSSFGQNLKTSTFNVEILFVILISVIGLVLFALLIGNMQKYLQSTTVRIEEMRVKRRDAEQWMSHRMLPDKLKERVRRYEQYKWQETRGVEERSLIRNLPKDLRRDINRHLCTNLLKKVPMFMKMDEQILDAVYDYLRPSLYTKNSYIIREGDPVDEMIFIMRGDLESATTNGGRTGFFNVVHLNAGDFCGEGLLTWALDTQSSSNLPISTRTVQAMTEVEAFALVADDLKTVASQFRRRLHHKDIQHIFRFCSVQWRTWAACFIQAAWRRYCRTKLAKALRQQEDKLDDLMTQDGGSSPSLAVTIYASRFAANALRNLRQHHAPRTSPRILPQRMPLLPQKPAEPDFTASSEVTGQPRLC